ncbi:hypothetical protein [Staphylococcus capitis]|nr:hypothetical protein [Staphylococcus capitis]
MKIKTNLKKGGYSTEIASNYMSVITFDHLEACEVRYDVYFKASDLKEVK